MKETIVALEQAVSEARVERRRRVLRVSAPSATLPASPPTAAGDARSGELPGDGAASRTEVPSMPHPSSDDDRVAAAYELVAHGFRRALEVSGLPAEERARLTRCWRHATTKSRRRSLAPVPDPLLDRQVS